MSGLEHLLEDDRLYLERKGWDVDVTLAGDPPARELMLVIHDFKLSSRYNPSSVDLLIRQVPGYPVAPLDSWWTYPEVFLADNQETKPPGASGENPYLGKNWQFWSRHPGWRQGVDNLETYMAIVMKELQG